MSLWDNAKNAALIEKMMRMQLRDRTGDDALSTLVFLKDRSDTHPHVSLMETSRVRQRYGFNLYTVPTMLAFALWVLDDLPLYFKMSRAQLRAIAKIAPADSEAAHYVYLARAYQRVCFRESLLRSKGEKP